MKKTVTAAQKHAYMSNLLASGEGRRKIAASVQQPLRMLRDYQSVARRAFMIDELPDGALPAYDKDVDVPSYVVAEEGDSIQVVVHGSRVQVPLFELASNPVIPFTQVKERRFDVISRIKKKVKDELFRREDQILFSILILAGENNTFNTPIVVTKSDFGVSTLAQAFASVERHGLRVDKIFMNPSEFPVLRMAGRDVLDFETQRELLRTGFVAQLWGAQIYLSSEVPAGRILVVTEPEYLGVLPVRIDLTVLPADEPAKRRFGWSVFENIGALCHNPKGVQLIKLG